MIDFKVTSKDSNQKIEKYIKKTLNNTPLSLIYKLFRKKDIKVNGKWVNRDYIVKENDIVAVYLPNTSYDLSKEKSVPKLKVTFDVLYEDDNILIVNKPVGLLVHDDDSVKYNTLANQVLYYLYSKGEYNPSVSSFTPAPAHRLDRNTSGIVIFGKTISSLKLLNECFKERVGLEKYYLALVKGKLESSVTIEKKLLKDSKSGNVRVDDKGLDAISIVKPIKFNDEYSLVEVLLKTGRTHQIRVHMASINHPVIGDKRYGDFELNDKFYKLYGYENQFLHAYKIKFTNMKDELSYLNGLIITSELEEKKDSIIKKIF